MSEDAVMASVALHAWRSGRDPERDELAALRVKSQSHSTNRKSAALHVTQQMHRKRSK